MPPATGSSSTRTAATKSAISTSATAKETRAQPHPCPRADALMHRKRQSDTDFDDVPGAGLHRHRSTMTTFRCCSKWMMQQQNPKCDIPPPETQSDIAPKRRRTSIELPLADAATGGPPSFELREQLARTQLAVSNNA